MSRPDLPPIPATWCWAPLGEIAEVKLGKMLSPKAQDQDLIRLPYLRNQNIRWGVIDYSDIKTMGFKPSELERYSLKPGDLLVCEGGEPGRCAVYLKESGGLMYQKALHRIRPYGGLVLPKYLQSCLWNYVANNLVLPRPSETTIQHLPLERMVDLPIPVAPYEEQERIVAEIEKHLTRLDAATDLLRRVQANLKRYRAAVLKAACEGRLVPPGAELARVERGGYKVADAILDYGSQLEAKALLQLPPGWIWVQLGQLLTSLRNGLSVRPDAESGVPILRISSVRPLRLDFGDVRYLPPNTSRLSEFVIEEGDLLFTRYNGSPDLVGVCAEARGVTTEIVFPDKIIRGSVDQNLCYSSFIEIAVNAGLSREFLARRIRTTAGQAGISGGDLRSLPVPLPPLAEQLRIVAEVQRQLSFVTEVSALVSKSLLRAGCLGQVILKHAFEGRLASQFPGDEPASALLERISKVRQGQDRERSGRRRPDHPVLEGYPAVLGVSSGKAVPILGVRKGDNPGPRAGKPVLTDLGQAERTRSRRLRAKLQQASPAGLKNGRGCADPLESFIDLPSEEQIDAVWESLFGRGTLERDEAIRTAAEALRDRALARFQRLRPGGALHETIEAALARGLRAGDFDRPKRSHVRAVLRDPRDYSPETFSFCLLESFDHRPIEEGKALRAAAEWARENLGLEYGRLREDGIILRGLREALKQAIRRGELARVGKDRIRRTGGV